MCEVFKQRPSLAAAMIGQAVPVTVHETLVDVRITRDQLGLFGVQ